MKTHHRHLTHLSHHRKLAFTLVELMMASAIFLVVSVGVMVGFQIFGLRVYTLSATKMVATADARKTLNALRQQIRSAKIIFVGNYANGSFNRIPNGQPQTGNALQIYFADTNDAPNQVPVIFSYLDKDGKELPPAALASSTFRTYSTGLAVIRPNCA